MSSYAYAKFYGKKNKEWKEITGMQNFNKLKHLCTYRGRIDSKLLESCSIAPVNEVTETRYEYFGLVAKNDLNALDIYKEEGNKIYLLENKEKQYTAVSSPKETENYYHVYYKQRYVYEGNWYDIDSFYKSRERFEAQLPEKSRRYFHLKDIKEDISFFTLNEEGRENLEQEIEILEEDIDELKERIYICQFMIDLLNYHFDNFDDAVVFIYIDD